MNKERQETGGSCTTTPGQVAKGNVSAKVLMATPKRLDSMGGSESRGKNNAKRSG